jgi:hypothetical protein
MKQDYVISSLSQYDKNHIFTSIVRQETTFVDTVIDKCYTDFWLLAFPFDLKL